MSPANRLPPPAGSRIDRTRPVAVTFEGRRYQGFVGDSIASALAANGVWLLSRSFKYHRPRAAVSWSGDDAGALVQVGDEPNVPADVREVEPEMVVGAQNYLGSLESDWASAIDRLGRFLPVGFYYKAFYRPRGIWNWWEKLIRRTAGLGRVNPQAAPDYFDKAYDFCDVAVVGAGPAGMAAALEAAESGAETVLVEREPSIGGSLTYARFDIDPAPSNQALADLQRGVVGDPRIRVLTRATCTGWFSDNWLSIVRGNRLYKTRARSVVVATGSIDQPAVFRNNDLPGVMFATGAQRLIRHYGVLPGRTAVVLASGPPGYLAALDLAEHGVDVAAIVDPDARRPADSTIAAARARGLRILRGHAVVEGIRSSDGRHLAGVRVGPVGGASGVGEPREAIECDALCVSVGTAPAAALLWQAGAALRFDEGLGTFRLESTPPHALAAGSVAGAADLDGAIASGRRSGRAAAADAGFAPGVRRELPAEPAPRTDIPPVPLVPHPKGKEFVDLDEDITLQEIEHSIAEGFEDLELVKRFTGAGMGPSQGRQSAVPTIRAVARVTGRRPDELGTTTTRPPAFPEKFGHLAGRSFMPVRRTPIHHRHEEAGAQPMTAGPWVRPAYYGSPTDREAAIRREVLAVRDRVGLIDVSTLGSFEIRGPDAAAFMDRVFTMAYRRQRVGRVRYVLKTDEAGVIVDDGVAARLGRDHFYVTASTSGAEQMYPLLLWYQAQWVMDVDIADVTPAYCGLNLAGPRSRAVLERLTDDLDLAPDRFPYLAVRQGTVAAIPARVLRIGFVGELAYEIHAPWSQAEALWDALMLAGAPEGIAAFGVEAQRVLRLEKGHIIVGQDTDGLTHPHEANMAWALSGRKLFFVGKPAIEIMAASKLSRRLVGYTVRDESLPLAEEGHLVVRGAEITGRVTSSAWSPSLERAIGLAYVAPDQADIGHVFTIKGPGGRLVPAEVVPLPFYDPDDRRQEV